MRGEWRDPEGLRDPVGWLADRAGTHPESVAAALEHEARRLDRPGDRAAADHAAAILRRTGLRPDGATATGRRPCWTRPSPPCTRATPSTWRGRSCAAG